MLKKSARKTKKTPKCVLAFKEAEGRKYRMVSALEGKKEVPVHEVGYEELI